MVVFAFKGMLVKKRTLARSIMNKIKVWFPYLFFLLLICTIGAAKWMTDEKERQVEQRKQEMAPVLEKIVANGREAYEWPMKKVGMIQDFAEFGKASRFPNLYHSAADYYATPGTEVYAVADGNVFFSGYEAGYGGLVIVKHKREGLYSLYGHVSAKRWLIEKGEQVTRGQLIGYIADANEGYGIGMVPHLHFSIRLGEPEDYPNSGRENWMTGYTTEHPVFHQFLDPNKFIAQSKLYHRKLQDDL